MTPYEITFIIRPDLDEEQTRAATDQVSSRLESSGGEVLASYAWSPPRRRMAYPIREFGDGYYFTSIFQIDPPRLREFENALKLNESVLRFLIVQATEANIRQAQQRMQQAPAAAAQPQPPAAAQAAPTPSADTASIETGVLTEPVAPREEPEPPEPTGEPAEQPQPETVEAQAEVTVAQEDASTTSEEPNEEGATSSSQPEPVATATTPVSTEGEE